MSDEKGRKGWESMKGGIWEFSKIALTVSLSMFFSWLIVLGQLGKEADRRVFETKVRLLEDVTDLTGKAWRAETAIGVKFVRVWVAALLHEEGNECDDWANDSDRTMKAVEGMQMEVFEARAELDAKLMMASVFFGDSVDCALAELDEFRDQRDTLTAREVRESYKKLPKGVLSEEASKKWLDSLMEQKAAESRELQEKTSLVIWAMAEEIVGEYLDGKVVSSDVITGLRAGGDAS